MGEGYKNNALQAKLALVPINSKFFMNHGLSSTLCMDLRSLILLPAWGWLGGKGSMVVFRRREENP